VPYKWNPLSLLLDLRLSSLTELIVRAESGSPRYAAELVNAIYMFNKIPISNKSTRNIERLIGR